MTTDQRSLLHVTEHAWDDARPRGAAVHVTLTASKLFSGRAALTKSEELRRLVDALGARGLPEDAVALEGAQLDVSTGLFTRSSSVRYQVRVQVTDLERLADVLEVIADSKQATLTHITWDHAGATDELVAACGARAAAKATRLATALGVTLGDVAEVHEEELADTQPAPVSFVDASLPSPRAVAYRQRSVAHELVGLELAPTKRVGVRVHVAYRVNPGSRAAP